MKTKIICLTIITLVLLVDWSIRNMDDEKIAGKIPAEIDLPKKPPVFYQIFLLAENWTQENIPFVPSRFIKDKDINYVSLDKGDSVTLFKPFKKMSDVEYDKWLNKSISAYQFNATK